MSSFTFYINFSDESKEWQNNFYSYHQTLFLLLVELKLHILFWATFLFQKQRVCYYLTWLIRHKVVMLIPRSSGSQWKQLKRNRSCSKYTAPKRPGAYKDFRNPIDPRGPLGPGTESHFSTILFCCWLWIGKYLLGSLTNTWKHWKYKIKTQFSILQAGNFDFQVNLLETPDLNC